MPELPAVLAPSCVAERPSAGKRRVTQSPDDQRRYTTVGEYLIRLAAEQQSRDAAPAMRRHDNQIAPLLFSGRDDTFGRMLILHVDDIAGHAVCLPTLGSAIEDAIGRRCRHFLKMTNWIGPMLPRFVSHVQGRPWLRHRDNGDVCIVMLGEGKPVFESLRRQFRAVRCNQDMFVHRWTSSFRASRPRPGLFWAYPGGLASQTPAWRALKISNITIQASGRVTGRGASLEGGQAYVARERAITQ